VAALTAVQRQLCGDTRLAARPTALLRYFCRIEKEKIMFFSTFRHSYKVGKGQMDAEKLSACEIAVLDSLVGHRQSSGITGKLALETLWGLKQKGLVAYKGDHVSATEKGAYAVAVAMGRM
jgi:hypothetical protein